MAEIYISWIKELPQNKEALSILKNSEIIKGIELVNTDNQINMIKDAGLKVSLHMPGMYFGNIMQSLGNPNLMDIFNCEEGLRVLNLIKNSDAPTVGFHLGYSTKHLYEMINFPAIPKENGLISNKEELFNIVTKNIISLEQKINQDLKSNKQLIFEALDCYRHKEINWDIQLEEAKLNKEEIVNTFNNYGINARLLCLTEPDFIKKIFNKAGKYNVKPVGLLCDVAHCLISADTKRYNGEFKGSNIDYFNKLLDASNGKTFQMHLNVPEGNEETGYWDKHRLITPGEKLSNDITELTRYVVEQSPELLTFTLEMDTGLKPVKHVKKMIKQANYVNNVLFKK